MVSTANTETVTYSERLWPTPWLYVVLLLLVPSVMLLFMPLNLTLGIVLAPIIYFFFAGLITVLSPAIKIENGTFHAGHANIPTSYIGEISALDSNELALAIGVRADARAYLLVRGWIHKGLKITNTDPTDPAPFWIVTTRRPEELKAALEAAKMLQA